MNHKQIEILGYIAGIATAGAFIPQAIMINKTHETHGLSFKTLIIFFIGQILWFSYGILRKAFPVAFFALITGTIYIFLISEKYKNKETTD